MIKKNCLQTTINYTATHKKLNLTLLKIDIFFKKHFFAFKFEQKKNLMMKNQLKISLHQPQCC